MQLRLIACTFRLTLTFALLATSPECFVTAHAGPNLAENGPAQPFAVILGRLFSRLDAKGYDMPFGGDVAVSLGLAKNKQPFMVRELPPLRDKATGSVHILYQLKDGQGYFVVRYSADGFIAFRFGPDFAFIGAAERPNGRDNSTVITTARAEKIFNEEMLELAGLADGTRD